MTVKELSQELNISEQALRQWCKKNNVRKERTQGKKATYILDCDTVNKAKSYYYGESNESSETKEHNQSNESKESSSGDASSQIIATLTKQLEVKDSQIKELSAQVTELIKANNNLTTALQAAQALHGMDKTQPVPIEIIEEPKPTPRPAAAPKHSSAKPHQRTKERKGKLFKTIRSIFDKS